MGFVAITPPYPSPIWRRLGSQLSPTKEVSDVSILHGNNMTIRCRFGLCRRLAALAVKVSHKKNGAPEISLNANERSSEDVNEHNQESENRVAR